MDGWVASHYIKDISPNTQILAYSSVDETSFQQNQTQHKFDKICKKDIHTKELITLVRQLGQLSIFPIQTQNLRPSHLN